MNKLAFAIRTEFPPASRYFGGDTHAMGFGQLASDLVAILVIISGALSIIFVIIAGIKFVTSSGDEKKLASAQGTITYAIIGLIVTVLSFAIFRIIQAFIVGL